MTRRDPGEDELMSESTRPDPRRDMRPEDSRARAEARAAELLDHGVMDAQTNDDFAVDPRLVPDGWSYEWKRRTVLNQEDPAYQVSLAQGGWEAVPADRHPELMPEGWTGKVIDRKGMVLMERPAKITEMVRKRDHRNALEPVIAMEEKLAGVQPGQFERKGAKGESMVKVGRSYEPMQVPDN